MLTYDRHLSMLAQTFLSVWFAWPLPSACQLSWSWNQVAHPMCMNTSKLDVMVRARSAMVARLL